MSGGAYKAIDGRLYTEADIRELVQHALRRGMSRNEARDEIIGLFQDPEGPQRGLISAGVSTIFTDEWERNR